MNDDGRESIPGQVDPMLDLDLADVDEAPVGHESPAPLDGDEHVTPRHGDESSAESASAAAEPADSATAESASAVAAPADSATAEPSVPGPGEGEPAVAGPGKGAGGGPVAPVAVGPGRTGTRGRGGGRRATGTARADEGPAAPPEHPRPAGSAVAEARIAQLHLRVGMLGLARAELETLAARGSLDVPALADLAEVRWRTGDLVGAGEAADAHLQAGGEELVALCVAAEAAATAGRAADARELAVRALSRGRDRLDDVFAGQPRSAIWPPDAAREGLSARPGTGAPDAIAPAGAPSVGPGAAPSAELDDVQSRIARGDVEGTATRLALILRDRPVLAPAVLAVADEALRVAGPGPEAAALHVARGDAYRLMGRETLASEAFRQASRALRGARAPRETT